MVNFSEIHRLLSYLIIFLGVLVEGEIVLILAGVLIHKGYLDIFDTIFIAFMAAIIHDLVYWLIGKKIAQTGKKKFLFIDIEKIEPILKKLKKLKVGNGLYVIVSKFAFGLNRGALIATGYLKTPIKELMRYNIPAILIHSIVFISMGYVFAYQADIFKKNLKTAAIFLTLFIVIIIIFENIFRRFIEKKTNRNYQS